MRTRKLQLGKPEIAEEIERRYLKCRDIRQRQRLLCVKLAAQGEHTSRQIVDICGVSKATVFAWIKIVRKEGLEALLNHDKPGPKPGSRRNMTEQVAIEFEQGIQSGIWPSISAVCRWFKEKHWLEVCYKTA